jgi:hypothetical protein
MALAAEVAKAGEHPEVVLEATSCPSATSRLDPWHTCPPGRSTPTAPRCNAPRSPTTSFAGPPPSATASPTNSSWPRLPRPAPRRARPARQPKRPSHPAPPRPLALGRPVPHRPRRTPSPATRARPTTTRAGPAPRRPPPSADNPTKHDPCFNAPPPPSNAPSPHRHRPLQPPRASASQVGGSRISARAWPGWPRHSVVRRSAASSTQRRATHDGRATLGPRSSSPHLRPPVPPATAWPRRGLRP